MNAAIYTRVSTAQQASPGHVSLELQRDRCQAYCAERGWTVVALETDTESGLRTTRQGYQRILELARSNAIQHVVVLAASRFGRRASEVLARVEELRDECGVELHSTQEDLSSFLMVGITAVINEEQSRTIARLAAPAKRHKAAQGYWLGHAPFGTVNDAGVLRPGPHFDLVRLAFELAAEGVAAREINRRINATIAPRYINLSTVRKMLRNPVFAGRVRWDGIDAQAAWEPLIDPDLFERAGARLALRYRERAPVSPSYPFWSVGLVHCGRCGVRMVPKIHVRRWGRRYAYFVCNRPDRVRVTRGCRPEHFLIDDVQDYVVSQLEELGTDVASVDALCVRIAGQSDETTRERQRRIDALKAEQARLAGRLNAAKSAHLDAPAVFTIADVKRIEAAVRDTLDAIARELAQPAPAPDIDADELRAFLLERRWLELRDTDPAAFRGLLRRFLPRIDVLDRNRYELRWARSLVPATLKAPEL